MRSCALSAVSLGCKKPIRSITYPFLEVTLTWWGSLVRIQSCLPNKTRSAGGLEGRSERVALFRLPVLPKWLGSLAKKTERRSGWMASFEVGRFAPPAPQRAPESPSRYLDGLAVGVTVSVKEPTGCRPLPCGTKFTSVEAKRTSS